MILTEKKIKPLDIESFDDYQGDFPEGKEYT
jgi:hypothetical protein